MNPYSTPPPTAPPRPAPPTQPYALPSPAHRRDSILWIVVGGVAAVSVLGVVAVVGLLGHRPGPSAGVRSIESARTEVDAVVSTVLPGLVAAHEQKGTSACRSGGGTSGVLTSTIPDPTAVYDAQQVVDAFKARGWVNATGSVTASTGKYDGSASSADGNVKATVFASGSGRAQPFIQIDTTVDC